MNNKIRRKFYRKEGQTINELFVFCENMDRIKSRCWIYRELRCISATLRKKSQSGNVEFSQSKWWDIDERSYVERSSTSNDRELSKVWRFYHRLDLWKSYIFVCFSVSRMVQMKVSMVKYDRWEEFFGAFIALKSYSCQR